MILQIDKRHFIIYTQINNNQININQINNKKLIFLNTNISQACLPHIS